MRPPGYEPGALPLRQIALFSGDAKNFIIHVQTVRKKGLAEDKRASQIDATWYRDSETLAILPAEPNILRKALNNRARHCLVLSDIPCGKPPLRIMLDELSQIFSADLLHLSFITPNWNYELESGGRETVIECPNLLDAIRAHNNLNTGLVAGYENANPKFDTESTDLDAIERRYWRCFGCTETKRRRNVRRSTRGRQKEQRWKKKMGNAGLETSVGDDSSGYEFPSAGANDVITVARAKELVAGVTSAELFSLLLYLSSPQTAASVAVKLSPSWLHLSLPQTTKRS